MRISDNISAWGHNSKANSECRALLKEGRMRVKIYIISSAIVWAAIIAGVAVVLKETPYVGKLLPILGGGAAWFDVIVPTTLRSR